MQVNPVIRVRLDNSKLTATEINPYAGKDGKKMDINHFNGTGGIINGEQLTMNDYHQKFEVASHNLREFIISKLNIENGEVDIPDKYTFEQYGDALVVGKIYKAMILEGSNIILL